MFFFFFSKHYNNRYFFIFFIFILLKTQSRIIIFTFSLRSYRPHGSIFLIHVSFITQDEEGEKVLSAGVVLEWQLFT